MSHRARSSQQGAGGTSHLRPVGKRAGAPPSSSPQLCSCLLTSKEEGKKQQSHDWEGLGFIPEQPTQDREGSAESPAPPLCAFSSSFQGFISRVLTTFLVQPGLKKNKTMSIVTNVFIRSVIIRIHIC